MIKWKKTSGNSQAAYVNSIARASVSVQDGVWRWFLNSGPSSVATIQTEDGAKREALAALKDTLREALDLLRGNNG